MKTLIATMPGFGDTMEPLVMEQAKVVFADADHGHVRENVLDRGVGGLEQPPACLAFVYAGTASHAAAADPFVPDLERLHRAAGLPREFHGIPPKRGELGLEIKRRSPYRQTLVFSLANDIDFYVPTRKAFAEGSYEVTTSSYQPGGGELLVDGSR